MIAGGGYAGRAKLPLIPLSDGAGEVVEAGSAVSARQGWRPRVRHLLPALDRGTGAP